MNIFIVVAIKDNCVEQSEGFTKHEEAVTFAWKLIKDDLFFDEIDENDEPCIPSSNPFVTESHVENIEGSATIEILSFII